MISSKKTVSEKNAELEKLVERFVEKFLNTFLRWVILVTAPAIWLYQSYYWLKYGIWPSITLTDSFLWMGAKYPLSNWIEIQRFLDWMPTSTLFAVMAILIIFISFQEAKNR